MRVRLRPAWGPRVLAAMYAEPHDHTRWADHLARVDATVALGRELCPAPASIADLSCGDGAVAGRLAVEGTTVILGDLAPGYAITGPIEVTLPALRRDLDLFVCCETVEHLDDPDAVLASIRAKARMLLLSTPLGETTNGNPEHYWGWDAAGVHDMLTGAGWHSVLYREVNHPLARYQVWGCQ